MMRKIFAQFILAIFIAALAGAASTNAQPCPTPPDCPNDPFIRQPPIIFPITLANGNICWLKIGFCSRLACGIWKDMYVDSITFLSEDCLTTALTAKQLLDSIIDGIMGQTPNAWNEEIPQCPKSISFWRVFTAGCFKFQSMNSTKVGVPCLQPSLCWAEYTCCREAGSNKVRHTLLNQGPAAPCPSIDVDVRSNGCIAVCPS